MTTFLSKWSERYQAYNYEEFNQINEYETSMKVDIIIIRLHKIISYLRTRPRTFDEINNSLDLDSESSDMDLRISHRSFQRDIINIRSIYGIDIIFDESLKKYKIDKDDALKNIPSRILNHLDVLMALTSKNALPEYILIQKHFEKDTNFLVPILKAINEVKTITFLHQKNYDEEAKLRTLNPYGLKEHDQRWYVFGHDIDKKGFRIFSLDRINNLEVTDITFEKPESIDDFFKYTYGVEVAIDEKPTTIKITLKAFQANFLKNLPIHHSQKIISENDNLTTFEFILVPKHNFIMKLLSYGSDLLNVEPVFLRNIILEKAKKLSNNLKNNF